MLQVSLDSESGVATLAPDGPLTAADFASAARVIDPYIKQHGKLKGMIIRVEHFPGWDSLATVWSHFQFVQAHHSKVHRIAFVTDSGFGDLAEHIVDHLVSAELKHFPFSDTQSALQWITSQNG